MAFYKKTALAIGAMCLMQSTRDFASESAPAPTTKLVLATQLTSIQKNFIDLEKQLEKLSVQQSGANIEIAEALSIIAQVKAEHSSLKLHLLKIEKLHDKKQTKSLLSHILDTRDVLQQRHLIEKYLSKDEREDLEGIRIRSEYMRLGR